MQKTRLHSDRKDGKMWSELTVFGGIPYVREELSVEHCAHAVLELYFMYSVYFGETYGSAVHRCQSETATSH